MTKIIGYDVEKIRNYKASVTIIKINNKDWVAVRSLNDDTDSIANGKIPRLNAYERRQFFDKPLYENIHLNVIEHEKDKKRRINISKYVYKHRSHSISIRR